MVRQPEPASRNGTAALVVKQLPRRSLGRTAIEVSVLGLGTVKFGRTRGLRYAAPGTLPSDETIADLIATAHSLGIDLLDTAPAYGSSETRLGAALEGQRDRWIIATKVGEEFDGKRSRFDFSADHTLRSVERSLERLCTDRLDIVSIHSDGRSVRTIEKAGAVQALTKLKEEGTIRAIGFSGKTPTDGTAALAFADVLMVTINADYRAEIPLASMAAEEGAGVLAKKPLAQGIHGPSALAATATVPGVSALVVGTTSAKHLIANAHALRGGDCLACPSPRTWRARLDLPEGE